MTQPTRAGLDAVQRSLRDPERGQRRAPGEVEQPVPLD